MSRRIPLLAVSVLAAALAAGSAAFTYGDDGCPSCPSGAQAGAPRSPAGPAGTATPAALPKGHPPLPQGHSGLPAGHPPIGRAAATQPAINCTLAIKATQGTPDGPRICNLPVRVEFRAPGRAVQAFQAQLDQHGTAMLEGLKVPAMSQPVVSLEHAGVTYEAAGRPVTEDQSDQLIRVTAYETTDKAPAWDITMRHVMLQRIPQGLVVHDMLTVQNPANRAWVGTAPVGGAPATQPSRVTLDLPVPPTASDVHLGRGFSPDARVQAGRVAHDRPLAPGVTQFQIMYLLPVKDGKAELDIVAPAPVRQMLVFLPASLGTVTAKGLELQKADARGARPDVRMYLGEKLPAQQSVSLSISGMAAPPAAAAGGPPGFPPAAGSSAKTIAAIGAGALLLASVALLLVKAKARSAGKPVAP